ncbi:MAG: hypothetical protein PHS44_05235 [Candidatus Dojkabacteria bacterium]|nr:hypothetical protein [Candidatus Dojkabacteria bacterium]
MNLQKLLLKNTSAANWFLERISPKVLSNLGKKKAIVSYKKACTTSAYQKFLKEKGADQLRISSFEDFVRLPIMDKKNYIAKYSLSELLLNPFKDNYTIERSSGYSGKPFYWPRFSGQDDGFVSYMKLGLEKIFGIKNKTTLLINTFALGTWVTGFKFGRAASQLANMKNVKMTVVNVGTNVQEAFEIMDEFKDAYEQVIIFGYPPMLKDLLELAKRKKFQFSKYTIHVVGGGEGFPEDYRDYLAEILEVNVDQLNNKIVSAYGSADTGLEIGYEHPITVLFRRLLRKNIHARKEVLGDSRDYVPHFFQFNPMTVFIEAIKNELVYTSVGGIPVVRYNLHDSGGVIEYDKMIEIIGRYEDINSVIDTCKPYKLPVVYVYGRSDGVVHVGGANIYIEQIKQILNMKNIGSLVTGKFYTYIEYDKKMDQEFNIVCEARSTINISKHNKFLENFIANQLMELNNEYNNSYKENPKKFRPIVTLIKSKAFAEHSKDSIKIKYKRS